MSAILREKKSAHWKDREVRMPIANRISPSHITRSKELPSSNAVAALLTCVPTHCDGSLDATMNIHVTGTHKAQDSWPSFAGSYLNRSMRRMNQMARAN